MLHKPPTASSSKRASSTSSSATSCPASSALGKKRGSYNCGRCGMPKKGHVCDVPAPPMPQPTQPTLVDPISVAVPAPIRVLSTGPNRLRRRALSFDEVAFEDAEDVVLPLPQARKGTVVMREVVVSAMDDVDDDEDDGEEDEETPVDGRLPASCLLEVLRRLPPTGLMAAAGVCKGWRDCTRRVWRSAEELRLRVPPRSQIGFVGSVLQKCNALVRLTLRMESDVDATLLACIAFSCTNLEELEINTADNVVNRITGDGLCRFVAEKRFLTSLKIEGCTNLGFLNLASSSLSTLWLSDLYCISKTVINCPNLKELSFDFSRQENDSTDLANMVDSLGRTCPRLQNIHIASTRLNNAAVLALADANLRGLRMLSLVLGLGITDASVAAIVQCYSSLELLDLSGSSISDSGIGMICNMLPDTLSRLLLALCPNITSSGIQFATAQLPLLELIDCGMSMQSGGSQSETLEETNSKNRRGSGVSQQMYQKLIIKHSRLKKLSLWGCSGLDALYLNCPQLGDLNLNECTNLNPERLLLQCPNMENVHASGCLDMLVGAIRSQIFNEFMNENQYPFKRLGDSSKRVLVPNFLLQQSADYKRKKTHHVHCSLIC